MCPPPSQAVRGTKRPRPDRVNPTGDIKGFCHPFEGPLPITFE